jgi:hypothetical protein
MNGITFYSNNAFIFFHFSLEIFQSSISIHTTITLTM